MKTITITCTEKEIRTVYNDTESASHGELRSSHGFDLDKCHPMEGAMDLHFRLVKKSQRFETVATV